MKKRIELKITGRVQGVFFRESSVKEARTLGLFGFVKNLSDGTVEIVAEGEEQALKQLVNWCRNGSDQAKVEKIDVKWNEATGEFGDFVIDR